MNNKLDSQEAASRPSNALWNRCRWRTRMNLQRFLESYLINPENDPSCPLAANVHDEQQNRPQWFHRRQSSSDANRPRQFLEAAHAPQTSWNRPAGTRHLCLFHVQDRTEPWPFTKAHEGIGSTTDDSPIPSFTLKQTDRHFPHRVFVITLTLMNRKDVQRSVLS